MEEKKKKKIKGLKTWLKENGYTTEQMQAFWDELIPLNKKVEMLHNAGYNWDETNLSILNELPTEKERCLKRQAEVLQKEKEEREAKEKAEAEKKYYNEHFNEIILNKIDSKENLTKSELKTLVFEYEHERTDSSDVYKNSRGVETIININDRYFCINWIEDLGDWGEHEFENQPIEVKLTEKVEIKTVKRWVRADSEDKQELKEVDIKGKRVELLASKVVIEKRKNGVEPAIFITSDNQVYMVCTTNSGDFSITNEGIVGERYDSDGNWCGQ